MTVKLCTPLHDDLWKRIRTEKFQYRMMSDGRVTLVHPDGRAVTDRTLAMCCERLGVKRDE